MKILALDSSLGGCSVALWTDDDGVGEAGRVLAAAREDDFIGVQTYGRLLFADDRTLDAGGQAAQVLAQIDAAHIRTQRAAGRLDLHGRFSPFVTQILAEDASGETWNARSASRFHVVAICSARAKWQE